MSFAPPGVGTPISDPRRNWKKYHRHTARQIQILERTFKENMHPDEKQRHQLKNWVYRPDKSSSGFSTGRLNISPFLSLCLQDNCTLRAENDKFRSENIAFRNVKTIVECLANLLSTGARQGGFRNVKTIVECLADLLTINAARQGGFRSVKTIVECLVNELINAHKGSSNSYAIKKNDEIERVVNAFNYPTKYVSHGVNY